MLKENSLLEVVTECVFQSPYDQYKNHNGSCCTIVVEIPSGLDKDEEVGEMYLIRFENGEEIQALPEELVDSNGKHVFCLICDAVKCSECSLTGR